MIKYNLLLTLNIYFKILWVLIQCFQFYILKYLFSVFVKYIGLLTYLYIYNIFIMTNINIFSEQKMSSFIYHKKIVQTLLN